MAEELIKLTKNHNSLQVILFIKEIISKSQYSTQKKWKIKFRKSKGHWNKKLKFRKNEKWNCIIEQLN